MTNPSDIITEAIYLPTYVPLAYNKCVASSSYLPTYLPIPSLK